MRFSVCIRSRLFYPLITIVFICKVKKEKETSEKEDEKEEEVKKSDSKTSVAADSKKSGKTPKSDSVKDNSKKVHFVLLIYVANLFLFDVKNDRLLLCFCLHYRK